MHSSRGFIFITFLLTLFTIKCCLYQVSVSGDGATVDSNCRKLTASWVRAAAEKSSHVPLCNFYEVSFNFLINKK
jgi:hypothetical protein